MSVKTNAAVTFNGNSNTMKSNTALKKYSKGQNIYSESSNLKFTVCKPGTTSPGTLIGHLEVDFDVCDSLDICSWSVITGNDIVANTYSVPALGCKMKKYINVKVDVTIEGVSGSFRVLQSNRVDDKDATAGLKHRHFTLYLPGKLTLSYLKLTWGEAGSGDNGGFISMASGNLAINFVHFDGSKTSGMHAAYGGCIRVNDGTVTIKESTFEGFHASHGGVIHVRTTTPMTIESTTFKNNEATVRFIRIS